MVNATATRTPARHSISRDFGSPPFGHFHPLPWVVATAAQLLVAGVPATEIPARMGMKRAAVVMAFKRWGSPNVRAAFFLPSRRHMPLTAGEAKAEARTFLDSLPKDDPQIRRARRNALNFNGSAPMHNPNRVGGRRVA